MRQIMGVLAVLATLGVGARPGWARVDLVERLEQRGIITAAERKELEAQQAPAVPAAPNHLSYRSRDGRFSGRIYGYGQVRYTFRELEDAENQSNFSVQRTRVGLKGHAFRRNLRYKVYVNVYSGNEKGTDLFDFFGDYAFAPWFAVKAGAYKVPYGVQWNVSASKLQFVERSGVDATFRFDRDTGVTVHGKLAGGLSYDAGVFNGEGRNRNNSGDGHLYVGRVVWAPVGGSPLAGEPSLNRPERPQVFLAASVAYDDDVAGHTRKNLNGRLTALGTSDVVSVGGFAGMAYRGFSLRAEGHRRRIDPKADGVDDETATGLYVQGGALVWRDVVEVAGRYEFFDPNTDASDDLTQSYGVALNVFFNGHRNKIQADWFRIRDQDGPGSAVTEDRFRVQYQVAF